MSTAKVNIVSDNKSLPLRVRVFSKWTSNKLRIKGICVTNIINQIKNGVILVNLAEVLTNSSKHKTWTRHPTKSFQFIENIELALCLFKAHGVRFHYQIVTPNEISAGNIKSINSLVWSLIMKYTIEPVVFSKNELDTISKKSSNNASNNHKINDEDNNNKNRKKLLYIVIAAIALVVIIIIIIVLVVVCKKIKAKKENGDQSIDNRTLIEND